MTEHLPIASAAEQAIHHTIGTARRELARHGLHIDWFRPHHHHQGASMHVASLTEGLVHDLEAAGVAVTGDMRKIIEHRHEIVSVLSHTADFLARLQASPGAGIAEEALGLNPAVAAMAVRAFRTTAHDAAALLAGPQPPADPAQGA